MHRRLPAYRNEPDDAWLVRHEADGLHLSSPKGELIPLTIDSDRMGRTLHAHEVQHDRITLPHHHLTGMKGEGPDRPLAGGVRRLDDEAPTAFWGRCRKGLRAVVARAVYVPFAVEVEGCNVEHLLGARCRCLA